MRDMRTLAFLSTVLFTMSAAAANPHVVLKTTKGEIEVELFQDKAPISVENFLKYVDDGFYDGTIFHRVIGSFMIQGGGFTKSLEKKKTRAPIKNEATNRVSNLRGTLAMARTGVVDSATAQFFINVVDNQRLDHRGPGPAYGYAVFGKVVRGMDVVDMIKVTRTGSCGTFQRDCPQTQIVIEKARRVKPATQKVGGPKMGGKGGLKGSK
jgi:cyclophilin family peptidyl-prolyl cis-trans isomerase